MSCQGARCSKCLSVQHNAEAIPAKLTQVGAASTSLSKVIMTPAPTCWLGRQGRSRSVDPFFEVNRRPPIRRLLFAVPGGEDDTFTALSRLDTMGSVRGRVGVVSDKVLLFATAGVAFADVRTRVTVASTDGSFPTTKFSDLA